jgi:hypothetical protein
MALWGTYIARTFHHASLSHALVMLFFKTLVTGYHDLGVVLETLIVCL